MSESPEVENLLRVEYVIHFSRDDGSMHQMILRPFEMNLSSFLSDFGKTHKIHKLEEQECEVRRTVRSTRDLTSRFSRDLTQWDHRFTRIRVLESDRPTLYIASPSKAYKIEQRLKQKYSETQVQLEPLIRIFPAPVLHDHGLELEKIIREEWKSTVGVYDHTTEHPQHALAIFLVKVIEGDEENEEALLENRKCLVSSMKKKERKAEEILLILFGKKHKDHRIDDAIVWNVFQTTHLQAYYFQQIEPSIDSFRLPTTLRDYLENSSHLHYLAEHLIK